MIAAREERERLAMLQEHERRTDALVAFLQRVSSGPEYKRNAAQRIIWWAERGFKGAI